MFKYNGYLIVTEPDYKAETTQGKVVDDLWCQVYDENDIEQKQKLGDFNLVRGASFNKSSEEAIEKAIMEVVEEDQAAFELVRKTNELDRMKELFDNALEYIGETCGTQEELISALKDDLGMTDEELLYYNCTEEGQENVEEGMKIL